MPCCRREPSGSDRSKSSTLPANVSKGACASISCGPDYYAKYPKACMGGWGRSVILIDPAGRALPCHAAGVIPGLEFDNVQDHDLRWIWEQSPAFRKFRGEDWMQEPCRSCDRRTQDFGGCRCQAMLLVGDAAATDPVCTLSPMHGVVESITNSPQTQPDWIYRIDPVSPV